MPQIKCLQCDYIFADPCKEVVSLLALMMSRNEQGPDILAQDTRISAKQEEIRNKGIVSMDDISVSVDKQSQIKVKIKALVLECINGHRHQYIVECN
jgi:hypothetical protein